MSALEQNLRARFGARLQSARPLADLTSFRIGGPADLFLIVETEDELTTAMAAAFRNRVPAFCLGSGTNLLVSDRGIRGLVVKLGEAFDTISIRPNASDRRRGGAVSHDGRNGGCGRARGPRVWRGYSRHRRRRSGDERGRVWRRNGACSDAVHGVTAEGNLRVLSKDEVGFAYRRTSLPARFVITRVDFELTPGDRDMLWSRVEDLRAKRAARQPNGLPNAGSVFKNPPGNFAGRLLEGAGLKGVRMGGAAFSDQHANFIVNLGGARAEEVRALIEMARSQVRDSTGVVLEPEVRLIGEW